MTYHLRANVVLDFIVKIVLKFMKKLQRTKVSLTFMSRELSFSSSTFHDYQPDGLVET